MRGSTESLEHFLELIEIPRFRKNLRHILFYYLLKEHEELMPDFKWFIEDMRFFFDFIDELESSNIDHQPEQRTTESIEKDQD